MAPRFLSASLLAITLISNHATAQFATTGAGPGVLGSSYVGPADIVASPLGWWGVRAVSKAYAVAGGNIFILRRASDSATQTFASLTTGKPDWNAINVFGGVDATGAGAISGTTLTFTGGHVGDTIAGSGVNSGTTITGGSSPTWTVSISQTVASTTLTLSYGLYVTTFFDQSGNSRDMTQATANRQPQLFSAGYLMSKAVGAIRSPRSDAGNAALVCNASSPVQAQPVSISYAAVRTTNTSLQIVPYFIIQDGFGNSANTMNLDAGTIITVPATDGIWHTMQAVYNGASSVPYVDGAAVSISSPGTTGFTAGSICIGASSSTNFQLFGFWTEAGMWAGSFTAPQAASMDANQRAYYGY